MILVVPEEVEKIYRSWMQEDKAMAQQSNPLRGYCERIQFTRTTCKYRSGKNKGKVRRRKTHEVELIRFLPSGRCVAVKDMDTPGLDSLAEEIFFGKSIPVDTQPAQLLLDYFRKL